MPSEKFRRFLSESKESRMSLREAKRICERAGYKVTESKTNFVFAEPEIEVINIDAENDTLTAKYYKEIFDDSGNSIGEVFWDVNARISQRFDEEDCYYDYGMPKAKNLKFDVKDSENLRELKKMSYKDLGIKNDFENEDEVETYFDENVYDAYYEIDSYSC